MVVAAVALVLLVTQVMLVEQDQPVTQVHQALLGQGLHQVTLVAPRRQIGQVKMAHRAL